MSPVTARLLIVLAVVAVATLLGTWWRVRHARLRRPAGSFSHDELEEVGLAAADGTVRGLLLSSPTCPPCRAVKAVLAEAADVRPSFRWAEVDAAEHLGVARSHHVLRVPTLFVIGPDRRIVARTSGVPSVREVVDLIDEPARVHRATPHGGRPRTRTLVRDGRRSARR